MVRAVVRIGLIRRRHSPERTQLHATMVRQSKKQLVVGALVAILEPVSNAGPADELE